MSERLRAAAGRREFIQSCKTHELHIAKLVATILVANWRRQLLTLQSVAMPIDVLKIVESAPALSAGGFLHLGGAAALAGISVPGRTLRWLGSPLWRVQTIASGLTWQLALNLQAEICLRETCWLPWQYQRHQTRALE